MPAPATWPVSTIPSRTTRPPPARIDGEREGGRCANASPHDPPRFGCTRGHRRRANHTADFARTVAIEGPSEPGKRARDLFRAAPGPTSAAARATLAPGWEPGRPSPDHVDMTPAFLHSPHPAHQRRVGKPRPHVAPPPAGEAATTRRLACSPPAEVPRSTRLSESPLELLDGTSLSCVSSTSCSNLIADLP